MSVAPSNVDALLGQVLNDRYAIERVVGQEHLGCVYAGTDRQVGLPVHLKVLRPDFVNDPKRFARFGREITATWLVSHPNTVEVLDWGNHEKIHYLVTEPLDGRSLEDELAGGPLPLDLACEIAAQIAAAIGAAHQEGIVHRALAPRNVLLLGDPGDETFVKVRDFGMSKLETIEEEAEPLTQTTTITTRLDDISYMAPEFLNTGNFVKKSDLFSLGALMYHMLVGEAPPVGAVVQPPSAAGAAGIPPWMDALVLDLLSPEFQQRPGAYRVVQQLEAGTGRTFGAPRAADDGAPETQADAGQKAPDLAVMAGVVLFVTIMLVGGAVIVSSGILLLVLLWVAA